MNEMLDYYNQSCAFDIYGIRNNSIIRYGCFMTGIMEEPNNCVSFNARIINTDGVNTTCASKHFQNIADMKGFVHELQNMFNFKVTTVKVCKYGHKRASKKIRFK